MRSVRRMPVLRCLVVTSACHMPVLRRLAVIVVHRRMLAVRCMSGVHCSPGVRDTLIARCIAKKDARRMPGARSVRVTCEGYTDSGTCGLHARCRCTLPGSDS